MDNLTKIVKMLEGGVSEATEIFMFVVLILVVFVSLYKKFNEIIALNDFDRLLIPKHERNIQQVIVKIYEYGFFSFLYFVIGFFLSFVFNLKIFDGIFGGILTIIVFLTFLVFHLLLFPKIVINEFLQKSDWRLVNRLKDFYGEQATEKILNVNLFLSIIMYTFFLGNPFINYVNYSIEYVVFLLLAPIYLLFICRAFTKYYHYLSEYLCQVISEEEFNAALPIVKYSLDKDKILFGNPTVDSNEELYLFDRACGKYFKFTKINIL